MAFDFSHSHVRALEAVAGQHVEEIGVLNNSQRLSSSRVYPIARSGGVVVDRSDTQVS